MAVATKSVYRWRLGAVVVKGGRVLGCSPNKYRNPPHIDHLNATVHAEIAALARCVGAADGSTLYIARIDSVGSSRLARPCPECIKRLTELGIRTIVYTDDQGTYQIERL